MEVGLKKNSFGARLHAFVVGRPKVVFAALGVMVAIAIAMFPLVKIDTDPENMLAANQPTRVFHDAVKKRFNLHHVIVVGVTEPSHADGVFNPATLGRIFALSKRIQAIKGVMGADLISPTNVDQIVPKGPGTVAFDWLLKRPPRTRKEALAVRDAALRVPMFKGTIVSEDGRAVALYVPIEKKDQSHRITNEIKSIVSGFKGSERFYITGLPVAEDTFGVEMFVQMAISAPLAALVIFLVMWWFFRSAALIASPMILALATVIITMGALIGSGFTVHIMSSMIPIFLMPIAVVDSVHILSEFSDRYRPGTDVKTVIKEVRDHLFYPMLYTSLTSAAGFLSLAFTPIPPVQIFGIFVAGGILLAFALTIIFIPAYVISLSPQRLEKLHRKDRDEASGWLALSLGWVGKKILPLSKVIVLVLAVVVGVSIYGITRININDNPVRWFKSSHEIRVADRILNRHFAGTYPAFLVLEKTDDGALRRRLEYDLAQLYRKSGPMGARMKAKISTWEVPLKGKPLATRLRVLQDKIEAISEKAPEKETPHWEALTAILEQAEIEAKVFQSPKALAYIQKLQAELAKAPNVGKTASIADLVQTIHRDLREGKAAYFRVPDTSKAVAQTILTYQSSHKPQDLWHFVTPDYRSANIWVQLKRGDNMKMTEVVTQLDRFLKSNPPPAGVTVKWAGETYLNVVWQGEMVSGMVNSLLGAFLVVLVMMTILFRSLVYGMLSMVPLTVTIVIIYGIIGLVGKDYDMPVAVLSSLSLGLSVDFAIHFLERCRAEAKLASSWRETLAVMFAEPGRAITRNVIVIAVGFLPLLFAPLVPYNTVGILMAAIMVVSGVVTLGLLPALMTLVNTWLFDFRKGESR